MIQYSDFICIFGFQKSLTYNIGIVTMEHLIGKAVLLAGGLLVAGNMLAQEANYQVIPLPQKVTVAKKTSSFLLKNGVKIAYTKGDKQLSSDAGFLASYVKDLTGIQLTPEEGGKSGIVLKTSSSIKNPEGYNLKVTKKGVEIIGGSAAGVFYGIQTLRKSIPAGKTEQVTLPGVVIEDAPRFSYRGAMLDVGRHFFPVDSVKKFIDMLALHNINRFHWHLSEDQGWRIEIKSLPELTQKGSKRDETVVGHNSGWYDGMPYGPFFYTQEEAKEVVRYAAERHITVIPEIDMPGHMLAALHCYPNLGCTGGPYKVAQDWGVFPDVLCAGNPETLKFIDTVLGEIIKIFPSEYIHIGGDECPKDRWKTCPKCQAKIKELGLKADDKHSAEEKLQSFIIGHAEKFLNAHGRQIIGWDEILEGGLAPNATVMSWRGESGGFEAARQHHNVVMTPNTYLYFDYYQAKDTRKEPQAIGGYLPVEKVYSYEPVPEKMPVDERKYIIGVQANLWTEYIPTFRQVQYMELPRMAALSEVQWSEPSRKNYQDFLNRLPQLTKVYDTYHYTYAKHVLKTDKK